MNRLETLAITFLLTITIVFGSFILLTTAKKLFAQTLELRFISAYQYREQDYQLILEDSKTTATTTTLARINSQPDFSSLDQTGLVSVVKMADFAGNIYYIQIENMRYWKMEGPEGTKENVTGEEAERAINEQLR